MKNVITTTLAVALLAASSMAFAADSGNGNGNGNGGKNGGISDADKTGSVKNGTETPDQADIDRCKMAMADDPTCVGVPKQ